MCGRVYRQNTDDVLRFLHDVFDAHGRQVPQLELKVGEIFPTNELLVVRDEDGGPDASTMRWGFQPGWAKRPLINAKSETVHEKSTWSKAFRERRCVLPVSGFYEWDGRTDAKPKPRFRFHLKEDPVMLLGGLWIGGEEPACTILTTRAGEVVEPLHDRQPVIVQREHLDRWLDPGISERVPLEDLMEPLDSHFLVAEPDS